mmetsp:Transcript_46168/g.96972  ORF Transcript_46168/g.96972 Transcript_46168/m.96972 type:complete len:163 (-) Transcript_46168:252-740(-)
MYPPLPHRAFSFIMLWNITFSLHMKGFPDCTRGRRAIFSLLSHHAVYCVCALSAPHLTSLMPWVEMENVTEPPCWDLPSQSLSSDEADDDGTASDGRSSSSSEDDIPLSAYHSSSAKSTPPPPTILFPCRISPARWKRTATFHSTRTYAVSLTFFALHFILR